MEFLYSIILGIIEGFCEFLPVSSSGHIAIFHNIFQLQVATPLFNVTLHLALLLSVFITYRSEVLSVWHAGKNMVGHSDDRTRQSRKEYNNRRIFVYILLGTLPMIPALFLRSVAGRLSLNTLFVSLMLFLNGAFIFYAARHSRVVKPEDHISIFDVLMVGFAQLIAIFPGFSRTATTISAGMLRGFPKRFAIRFSILLRVPTLIACICIYLFDAIRTGIDGSMIPAYLIGSVFAVVAGVFSLRFLRWMISKNGFDAFAYYCWGAGILTLLLSLIS